MTGSLASWFCGLRGVGGRDHMPHLTWAVSPCAQVWLLRGLCSVLQPVTQFLFWSSGLGRHDLLKCSRSKISSLVSCIHRWVGLDQITSLSLSHFTFKNHFTAFCFQDSTSRTQEKIIFNYTRTIKVFLLFFKCH